MDLIVGLPYENKARFGLSFNDLFSLQPHALQIGFLKLLKGSGVRRMEEYQYISDPDVYKRQIVYKGKERCLQRSSSLCIEFT